MLIFFGNEDPIGKVLQGNGKDNYTVAGVLADFPENSSFKADILFSFELAKKNYQSGGYWKSLEQDWGDYFYATYVLIKPGTSAKVVADKLTAIHLANQKEAVQAKLQYVAEPLLHLHLYNADGSPGGLQQLWIQCQGVAATLAYSAVGTLILLMITKVLVGLRVGEEEEREGLDLVLHGEQIF